MEYNPQELEHKWQKIWKEKQLYKTTDSTDKPKYYVLDMFPYPSGAGLHVGHPLGYIASDIVSRYKRHKGFNVLHPMGYDSFGLPAEQYAIQTGQHPKITTEENIARYREQLDRLGFSFDWSREVRTSDPSYYKWTQWIFIRLFNSWYNHHINKAVSIDTLEAIFAEEGYKGDDHDYLTGDIEHDVEPFTAAEWASYSANRKSEILLNFRLAYLNEASVNWCPGLGTVLANEEVKDGFSERGGFPVERKLMKQWSLRITAYAERLHSDLEGIDWSDSIKEAQRNWIGKSTGAELAFSLVNSEAKIPVFTTRPDTIFGVSFVVLAPEHELVAQITTAEQKAAVDAYVSYTSKRSERDRMADVKHITGEFTGAYAIHPFTHEKIPVWIGDYVLVGYGTGAVMAVPAGDQRDYEFAKHFNLPILPISEGIDISEKADADKNAKLINSDFLNGLHGKKAIQEAIAAIEKLGIGKGKVNFRLRDAIFGRQRYWGEPIPVYYKEGIPQVLRDEELPLVLPEVDKYLPTEDGEPPLARAQDWKYEGKYEYEWSTMPGWAGSSWYFLRYMDPQNTEALVSKNKADFWQQVDLYMGGAEHATGHLLYVRFWTKFLFDLGIIGVTEPAKKLINQGMIQGRSNFIYRINGEQNKYVSFGLKAEYETIAMHVDVNLVKNDVLDIEGLKLWRDDFKEAEFILEDGEYHCGVEVEKMSKSKWNVVNPDAICEDFGADTLRLYEMFLGPLEQHKPWNTNGISGVYGFLRKLWRLFHQHGEFEISLLEASADERKILHKTIKKISEDIERYSFNTVVSAAMICVNDLQDLKCNKREILEPLLVLLAPFAPHIAEELWEKCGNTSSVTLASWPSCNEAFLVESAINYPVQFNGKTRFTLAVPVQFTKQEIEDEVLSNEQTQKYLEGKAPKKIIVVPNKIVNLVF